MHFTIWVIARLKKKNLETINNDWELDLSVPTIFNKLFDETFDLAFEIFDNPIRYIQRWVAKEMTGDLDIPIK